MDGNIIAVKGMTVMSEIKAEQENAESIIGNSYTLISPRQFYELINRKLDEPIGITTVYRLMKEKDFPAVKIGNRYFVIENRVLNWLQSLIGKTILEEEK